MDYDKLDLRNMGLLDFTRDPKILRGLGFIDFLNEGKDLDEEWDKIVPISKIIYLIEYARYIGDEKLIELIEKEFEAEFNAYFIE